MGLESTKDKKYLIAEQATFGTAIADSAAFIQVDCDETNMDRDVTINKTASASGYRDPVDADFYPNTRLSAPKLSLSGIAKQDELDWWLYSVMQSVSEGATTPYAKTFTWHTTQPDFTSSAGWFATVIEYFATASTSWKAYDMIGEKLTLTINPASPLMYNLDLIGRGVPTANANPSGTITRNSNDFWYPQSLTRKTVNFGSGAQTIRLIGDSNLVLPQTVKLVGQSSSKFETFALLEKNGTFQITLDKDANTTTAITNQDAGTAITVNFGWESASTVDGYLDINYRGIIENIKSVNVDGIVATQVTGSLSRDTSTPTEPVIIVMSNAVDRSW